MSSQLPLQLLIQQMDAAATLPLQWEVPILCCGLATEQDLCRFRQIQLSAEFSLTAAELIGKACLLFGKPRKRYACVCDAKLAHPVQIQSSEAP